MNQRKGKESDRYIEPEERQVWESEANREPRLGRQESENKEYYEDVPIESDILSSAVTYLYI